MNSWSGFSFVDFGKWNLAAFSLVECAFGRFQCWPKSYMNCVSCYVACKTNLCYLLYSQTSLYSTACSSECSSFLRPCTLTYVHMGSSISSYWSPSWNQPLPRTLVAGLELAPIVGFEFLSDRVRFVSASFEMSVRFPWWLELEHLSSFAQFSICCCFWPTPCLDYSACFFYSGQINWLALQLNSTFAHTNEEYFSLFAKRFRPRPQVFLLEFDWVGVFHQKSSDEMNEEHLQNCYSFRQLHLLFQKLGVDHNPIHFIYSMHFYFCSVNLLVVSVAFWMFSFVLLCFMLFNLLRFSNWPVWWLSWRLE